MNIDFWLWNSKILNMIFLIDGHNLIGKMPDISLTDVDDEEKLLNHLQNWAAGSRQRRLHVVFDAGKFSGQASSKSEGNLRVEFVKRGRTADSRIIQIIKEAKNPKEHILVTSDREIIFVARQRRITQMSSSAFVRQMIEDKKTDMLAAREPMRKPPIVNKPQLSEDQVENWLKLFENAPKPAPRKKSAPQKVAFQYDEAGNPLPTPEDIREREIEEAAKYVRSADELKTSGDSLTESELNAWMTLFADAPKPEGSRTKPVAPTRQNSGKIKRQPTVNANQKQSDSPISQDDLELWLKMFGDG